MERRTTNKRPGWQKIVSEQGVIFHTHEDGSQYWGEGNYYSFSMQEIEKIEKATNELHQMCLAAAQHIIDKNRFSELGIPFAAIPLIEKTWELEPPAIYGRFDLAFDGINPPKMLEYNADTPTSLVEAAVAQWFWLKDLFPEADQFNSLHEALIAKWRDLKDWIIGADLYFAHLDEDTTEDFMTTTYLRDVAEQAGIKTKGILIKDLGWDSREKRFVDLDSNSIVSIFKLYPWEWLIHEEYGSKLIESFDHMQWIEPAWKMLLSNKGILPILWELYPNQPNLLPAYFNRPSDMRDYVKKPMLSREGANITISRDGQVTETSGDYGEEGYIFQAIAPIPDFGGFFPVIGSWMIDQEARGMGIRESRNIITDNRSLFVPHIIS